MCSNNLDIWSVMSILWHERAKERAKSLRKSMNYSQSGDTFRAFLLKLEIKLNARASRRTRRQRNERGSARRRAHATVSRQIYEGGGGK
jgi:hypothetical protein